MEELKKIWLRQKEFSERANGLKFEYLSEDKKFELLQKFILAIHEETTEFLKTTHYKSHVFRRDTFIRTNTIIEGVDIFKYWLTCMQIIGVSSEEFLEWFYRKSQVVEQKFNQQFVDLNKKIAIIDIDGCIIDYPQCFFDFINKKTNLNIKDERVEEDIETLLSRWFTKEQILKLKHEYRESGIKADLPALPDAVEAIKKIKDSGYNIVLLSARPIQKYERIYSDTLLFLQKNNIVFDVIEWGKDKHVDLIEKFNKFKVAFFIEDSQKNAEAVASYGAKVFLLRKPYTKEAKNKSITIVNNWQEIVQQL